MIFDGSVALRVYGKKSICKLDISVDRKVIEFMLGLPGGDLRECHIYSLNNSYSYLHFMSNHIVGKMHDQSNGILMCPIKH